MLNNQEVARLTVLRPGEQECGVIRFGIGSDGNLQIRTVFNKEVDVANPSKMQALVLGIREFINRQLKPSSSVYTGSEGQETVNDPYGKQE
jgi:hypothetical protein